MEKKITKRENFEMVREVVVNSNVENKVALIEFIDHELELLANKAQRKSTTLTPTQKENLELQNVILEVLAKANAPMSISEMLQDSQLATYTTIAGKTLTNQKISAIILPMLRTEENANGSIVRTMDKKKALFAIAE